MKRPSLISVLDADPEMGAGLDGDAREIARRHVVVTLQRLPTGSLAARLPEHATIPPAVGLLVLDGVITRDLHLANRSTTELLGQGDIIRPWDDDATRGSGTVRASWTVLEPASAVVLDRRFAAIAGRWPSILDVLVQRMVRRSRQVSMQCTIAQVPRIDARILTLMWMLADRWGRVTPQGVHVPLELTHETIAKLVAARRPSVTTAIGILTKQGDLQRHDHGWLLHGDPHTTLPELL
ncbi:Crp/Fnr family transcriptional regulator [Baekduia soli]|uniref:Crp/Fnr family transcriptional regulator n=1 Tax=Baekduia soli TaxID=496014 RepID=A0A5B8U335_9ACTN|nr:Crp/Fnr family transcriptional regulator [Baekduia soli]QEC47434.1 Crp/Fnr family transcriptional regulator [Baekduia soli]